MSKLTGIIVLLVVGCLITIPLLAAESVSQDAAITAGIMALPPAWAKHDPKAMASLWAEDGDLINPFGRVAKNRAEVEKLFADEHAGPMKASHLDLKVTSIRMLGRNSAVVDVDCQITGIQSADGKEQGPMDHHVLVVMHKDRSSSTWQFLAVRAFSYLPKP